MSSANKTTKRLAAGSSPKQVGQNDNNASPYDAHRVKPVRVTVDLSPALFRAFDDWCFANHRRSKQGVIRALIAEAIERPELAPPQGD